MTQDDEPDLTLVPLTGRRDIARFDPKKTHMKVPAYREAIEAARRMREWEALFEAADWMIAEIRDFVAWWDLNVGVRKSAGGSGEHGASYNAEQRSMISREQAETETAIKQQQVSRWRTALGRPDFKARMAGPSYVKTLGDAQNRAELQTGEMEWYTPSIYVEKVRRVLGVIDLDPASCTAAQETVAATQFFTKDDDGLALRWHGRVWLNPPYAGGIVAAFAAKMVESWNAGDLQAAIMLTNSYTETSWWHGLAKASTAVCFTRGRIKFESPHGEKCAPTNGQSFFYFGKELDGFAFEFADVGLIMSRAGT
jgi:hypothetical protein